MWLLHKVKYQLPTLIQVSMCIVGDAQRHNNIVSVLHMYESVCVVLLSVSHTYKYTIIERKSESQT